MGRLTRKYPVVRVGPAPAGRRIETVAVEEPLEIRLNGEPFVVTMRTPGADIDLIHGLLHSEGVITRAGGHLAGPLLRRLRPRRREHLQRAGRQPGPARRAAAGRPAAAGADHQCLRALRGDQHRLGAPGLPVPARPRAAGPAGVDHGRAEPAARAAAGLRPDRRPARCGSARPGRHPGLRPRGRRPAQRGRQGGGLGHPRGSAAAARDDLGGLRPGVLRAHPEGGAGRDSPSWRRSRRPVRWPSSWPGSAGTPPWPGSSGAGP